VTVATGRIAPAAGDTVAAGRAAIAAALAEWSDAHCPPGPLIDTEPPASGDWSLPAEAVGLIVALVHHLGARELLEFGSGESTVALARAATEVVPPGTVTTLENDPDYAARCRAALARQGLAGVVRVVSAPLVVRRSHRRQVPVYRPSRRSPRVPRLETMRADLVLVDGPPLPLGGREGAFHQALSASRPGTVMVLDDTRREHERELLVEALERYGGRIEAMNVLGFAKGLALILVTGHIGPDDLPEEITNV